MLNGTFIQKARKKNGFSQAELADLIGVHETTIRRWESNRSNGPNSSDIAKLASALHVTEAELLNGPERQEWILKIRVSIDPQEEEIDMTEGGCISNLDLTRKGAALTLGADYATFEDDSKFEGLINQLRAAREMVVENGRKMLAVGAAAMA